MTEQVKRCFYCNQIVLPSEIASGNVCVCGSRKLRVAFGISDEEEQRLKADGYVFNEEDWSDNRETAWKD